MKLTRTLLILCLFFVAVLPARSQTSWYLSYDLWPNMKSHTPVTVKEQNGTLVGSEMGNRQFGLGAKVVFFGTANNYIRFAMQANYRKIELNDSYRLPDSAKNIHTVEYMLGAQYWSNKPTFHIGSIYTWLHASAMAGMGWSYNFDACLSAGMSFYPLHGNTENFSGVNVEFVYWPVTVKKSLNGLGAKLPYTYIMDPTWCIRLGFVFNNKIKITFNNND